MVVRRGGNEVQFREFARWGEPLEQGIGRILREELLARGTASSVAVPGSRPANGAIADFDVSVRVLGCEGVASGTVEFHALWEVNATKQGGATLRGDFHPGELRWDGRNEASLAAALSQAVSALAGEVAAALKK
jgi:uncharacterized lipoprotein YmbA